MTKKLHQQNSASPKACAALKLNLSNRSNGSFKSNSSTDGALASPIKPVRKTASKATKKIGFIAKPNEDKVFKRAQEVISQNQRETFYIMDIDEVRSRMALWKKHMPTMKMYYAVKANNDKHLLKMMIENGSNFDCASVSEIETVLALGAAPDRIIFANACKAEVALEYAAAKNVKLMTFDCVEELDKIMEIFPTAELVLRIAVEETNAPCPMGKKFGAPLELCQAILKKCKDVGANLRGVSFHVGSGGCAFSAYHDSLRNAKQVFDMAADLKMKQLDFLDIGGGFSMSAANEEYNFDKVAPKITKLIKETFPQKQYPNLQLAGEPGRFLCQSCVSICCRIFLARVQKDVRHYFVDSGVCQAFSCQVFDHEYFKGQPLLPKEVLTERTKNLHQSFIWGQTCAGFDWLSKDELFPYMERGEWIIYRGFGAYNNAIASNFNGFPFPKYFYC